MHLKLHAVCKDPKFGEQKINKSNFSFSEFFKICAKQSQTIFQAQQDRFCLNNFVETVKRSNQDFIS